MGGISESTDQALGHLKLRIPKLIILTIFLLVVYAGYAYFRAVADHQRLEQAVNLLFENPNLTTPARLSAEFQRSANELGIVIPPEEIHFSLEDTDEKSVTGQMIQPSGMLVQSKILTLDASYSRTVLGFPKRLSIHRRKVFTYRVEQPMTIPDEIPMD